MTVSNSGIVYLLTNSALPNIVKVGRTSQPDVEIRLKQLNLGKVIPFECVYSARVENVHYVENDLISLFALKKVSVGEWFEIDVSQAVEVVKFLEKKFSVIRTFDHFDPIIYQIISNNPELLKIMDWRLFEEMLADILKRFNYTVELTKRTKDGGIDIIAIRKDNDFGDHKYLLQAKRYNNAIQVEPVRELLFLHNHLKATKCCLVSTSTFTKGAWELAALYNCQLELKDQTGVLEWINKIITTPNR